GASAAPTPSAAAPLATDAPAAEVMSRVTTFVERYGDAASVLVGIEKYRQEALTFVSPTRMPKTVRVLKSEVALVRNSSAIGGWLAFRDVIEVDGKPVKDRGARLATLFDRTSVDVNEARRIS